MCIIYKDSVFKRANCRKKKNIAGWKKRKVSLEHSAGCFSDWFLNFFSILSVGLKRQLWQKQVFFFFFVGNLNKKLLHVLGKNVFVWRCLVILLMGLRNQTISKDIRQFGYQRYIPKMYYKILLKYKVDALMYTGHSRIPFKQSHHFY